MAGIYLTRQQDIILSCLSDYPNQSFSAKDIYDDCRRNRKTTVGLSTVYRHLENLIREGKVRKVLDQNNLYARYQYLGGRTDGFCLKCDSCGKMTHIDCDQLQQTTAHLSDGHGFQVDLSRSVLYGRCKDCQ